MKKKENNIIIDNKWEKRQETLSELMSHFKEDIKKLGSYNRWIKRKS